MNDEPGVPSADFTAGRPDDPARWRLLPWTGEEGRPAYVSGDGGVVSRVADVVEHLYLAAAEDLLDRAPAVLDAPAAGADELRCTARELAGALRAALRVAHSRGGRAS